jgi:hypothetical protein
MFLRGCLESIKQVIFILGNREQGTGNREHRSRKHRSREWGTLRNNKIQSPPFTRGGLGWGETIVDTLIMTYQTSSYSGKYEIRAETVIHYVEISLIVANNMDKYPNH